MILRSMVTLQKRNKANHYWVLNKETGARLGVIMKSKSHTADYMWRELGFDTKPHNCKTPEEGVARLLLKLNEGRL